MKISVKAQVNSDMAKVWSAWTTPEDINHWNAASSEWHNPHSVNDLRVDGRFCYRMEAKNGSMGFDFEGTYLSVIKHQLIEYVMDDGRAVSVLFKPQASGVEVQQMFEAESANSEEMQRQGWQAILDNFKAHVESAKPIS